MEQFNGNSNASKERPPMAPVTSNVTVRPESEAKKLKNKFFAQDGKTVIGQVFENVVIPGLQKLFSDTIKNGVDWIVYGSKGVNKSGISNVSYTNYYRNPQQLPTVPNSAYRKPATYSVNEVTFDDRGYAEETLMRLQEAISQFGSVSVADFYDMVNQRHEFTDVKYGWRDLSMASVVRNRDGYSIEFPRVTVIEN